MDGRDTVGIVGGGSGRHVSLVGVVGGQMGKNEVDSCRQFLSMGGPESDGTSETDPVCCLGWGQGCAVRVVINDCEMKHTNQG